MIIADGIQKLREIDKTLVDILYNIFRKKIICFNVDR